MGNGNTGLLGTIKWSSLVVAINSTQLERPGTIIYLNQFTQSFKVIGDITLFLILIEEPNIHLGMHFDRSKNNYFYVRETMAWGLWNKIKQGFKKVGNFVKKAASFVNDKVIKPFKPVITNVANAILPGSGRIVEAVSDGIDDVANGNFKGAAQRIVGMANPDYVSANGVRPNADRLEVRPYRRLNR